MGLLFLTHLCGNVSLFQSHFPNLKQTALNRMHTFPYIISYWLCNMVLEHKEEIKIMFHFLLSE